MAKVAPEAIRDGLALAELSKKYGVKPTRIGTGKRGGGAHGDGICAPGFSPLKRPAKNLNRGIPLRFDL